MEVSQLRCQRGPLARHQPARGRVLHHGHVAGKRRDQRGRHLWPRADRLFRARTVTRGRHHPVPASDRAPLGGRAALGGHRRRSHQPRPGGDFGSGERRAGERSLHAVVPHLRRRSRLRLQRPDPLLGHRTRRVSARPHLRLTIPIRYRKGRGGVS